MSIKKEYSGLFSTARGWSVIVVSIVTLIATFRAIEQTFFNHYNIPIEVKNQNGNDSLLQRMAILTNEMDYLEQNKIEIRRIDSILSDTALKYNAKIRLKIYQMDVNVTYLVKEIEGLRQAFNPNKPEEVLTIVRLKDEIEILEQEQKSLSIEIKDQQNSFQESITREIDKSSQSIYLILVVLIPLVLQFLYTIWKDVKEKQKINPN